VTAIVVDGKRYEVPQGRTILQALDDLGLLGDEVVIPHYCWHPKLSIDGSCRMCQVEIKGQPKLQIACNTPVAEGMEITTHGERVEKAREAVMELLLINHPLDCPICDQAGECRLQDYAFEYGVKHARTKEPRRPAKKAVDLGPTIVLDQERCILCRRCVRFCREISKTSELGVFDRGDESVLDTFPGIELDNPYSMNVADICPVGALTTRDFRFKIRVWFLEDVPSVCNRCANGCNVWASKYKTAVYRFLPRRNDGVNDTWMCDVGRLSYKAQAEGRLENARLRGQPAPLEVAVERAAELLRQARAGGSRVVGIASPFASNEDLFTLRRLLGDLDAPPGVFRVPRGSADDFLIKEEKAPNAAGARALGFAEDGAPGRGGLGIALGHEFDAQALSGLDALVLIDTHESELVARADVSLPARWFLEKDGSFTNFARRVQRFSRAVEPRFQARAEGDWLAQIAAAAGLPGWRPHWDAREVSRELARAVPAFAGCDLAALGPHGRPLAGGETAGPEPG
jgi:NADH-quinone oxidoreductase subunit G